MCVLVTRSCAVAVDYEAMHRDAKALALSGNTPAAVELCNRILAEKPGAPAEPRARVLMGYILLKTNAPVEDATAQFQATADQFPDAPEAAEALHRLGRLALRKGVT